MSKTLRIASSDEFIALTPSSSASQLRRKSSTSPLKFQMAPQFVRRLEMERRKLPTVESQQIIAVLDDTLQALEILSRFSEVCENFEFFEQFLGPEITADFQRLCTSLNEGDCDTDFEDKQTAERDAKIVAGMRGMTSTQKLALYSTQPMRRIRDIVKTLVRHLIEKRGAYNAICMDTVPSTAMIDLLHTMEELRKFVYTRLQTTEAKEKERLLFLENSPTREKSLKSKIEELESELSQIKLSAGQEVTSMSERIEQLEDDIEKMVTISSEAILQRRMEIFQEAEQEEKISKEEQIILEAELQVLQRQYEAMLEKHRNAELNLRRKNFKISVEVENWVLKYDKDMSERLAAYEEVNNEYIIEKDKLAALEAEFIPIEAAYNALLAERAEKKRQRLLQMANESKYIDAATVIQKYVRGWLVRKKYKLKLRKK